MTVSHNNSFEEPKTFKKNTIKEFLLVSVHFDLNGTNSQQIIYKGSYSNICNWTTEMSVLSSFQHEATPELITFQ